LWRGQKKQMAGPLGAELYQEQPACTEDNADNPLAAGYEGEPSSRGLSFHVIGTRSAERQDNTHDDRERGGRYD
jgi:hypothetical protein